MSTLLTSMETIVDTTPWLDRPRNAAKVMAGVSTVLGVFTALPSIYVLLLIFPLVGYALCIGYWRMALGFCKRPAFWWKTSMVYNGFLAIATFIILVAGAASGPAESLLWGIAMLAWQLFAIHLSYRGWQADSPWA